MLVQWLPAGVFRPYMLRNGAFIHRYVYVYVYYYSADDLLKVLSVPSIVKEVAPSSGESLKHNTFHADRREAICLGFIVIHFP